MKELSPNDRPREKLLTHGARALGDNELVALVLGRGCHRRDALGVANELLTARGGLQGLVQARCDDLARVTGIGPRGSSPPWSWVAGRWCTGPGRVCSCRRHSRPPRS